MDPALAELITLSGFAVRDYMKMDLSQQFVFVNRYADYLEWKMKCEKSSFITLNISSFVLTSTHFLLYPYAYSVGGDHDCEKKKMAEFAALVKPELRKTLSAKEEPQKRHAAESYPRGLMDSLTSFWLPREQSPTSDEFLPLLPSAQPQRLQRTTRILSHRRHSSGSHWWQESEMFA